MPSESDSDADESCHHVSSQISLLLQPASYSIDSSMAQNVTKPCKTVCPMLHVARLMEQNDAISFLLGKPVLLWVAPFPSLSAIQLRGVATTGHVMLLATVAGHEY